MADGIGIQGTYLGYTREQIVDALAMWQEAQRKIAKLAQSVTIEGKTYSLANLNAVAEQIRELNYALRQLDSNKKFTRVVNLRDGGPNR